MVGNWRKTLGCIATRLVVAFCAGVFAVALREVMGFPGFQVARVMTTTVVFPFVIVWLNRPLISYLRGIAITLVGCSGFVGATLVTWHLHYHTFAPFVGAPPWGVFSALVAICATMSGISCAAVAVRRRYRPIYGEDQCKRCGYLLHGLTSGRCPECGTRFNSPTITQNL